MKIDGREIANEIYDGLRVRVKVLKEKGITPQIAVILIGDDPASISYISQKRKWASSIAVLFSLIHYPSNISEDEVIQSITHLNNDETVQGIIVQRPLPLHIDRQKITQSISPDKDIDGFRPDSPYDVPVALAVLKVLNEIYSSSKGASATESVSQHSSRLANARSNNNFLEWLNTKSITVIGKGETAGGPIIKHFQKLGLNPKIISRNTENPESIIHSTDIVISAVGKTDIIRPEYLKQDAILLGVGIFKGEDGKLHGDYTTDKIKTMTSFYTPVTGGVGPVNVAYLFNNLVASAEKTHHVDTLT